MDRLNEQLRALGEHARQEVDRRPPRSAPVRRVKRQRSALVATLSGLFVLFVAASGFFLIRSEPSTEVVTKDEWVSVGTYKEIRQRSVLYVEDHQVFVVRMGKDLIALSAWVPNPSADGGRDRMLYCTMSNLFENEQGDVFDRSGALLESRQDGMPRVGLRIREQTVEIAPDQISPNESEPVEGSSGPSCGEWGPVVEGPAGFALASEAPPQENKASLHPPRVEVGERAELRFAPGRHTSGLRWDVYRFVGALWQWHGILVAGPGYESRFDIAPLGNTGIDDIGFGGSYTMELKIPKLEPGRYRLVTSAITNERNLSVEERTVWHYADFEVTE